MEKTTIAAKAPSVLPPPPWRLRGKRIFRPELRAGSLLRPPPMSSPSRDGASSAMGHRFQCFITRDRRPGAGSARSGTNRRRHGSKAVRAGCALRDREKERPRLRVAGGVRVNDGLRVGGWYAKPADEAKRPANPTPEARREEGGRRRRFAPAPEVKTTGAGGEFAVLFRLSGVGGSPAARDRRTAGSSAEVSPLQVLPVAPRAPAGSILSAGRRERSAPAGSRASRPRRHRSRRAVPRRS